MVGLYTAFIKFRVIREASFLGANAERRGVLFHLDEFGSVSSIES